jgi:dipeptidyl aminopeptidase/acylaminoacyl peptidase
MRRLLVLAALAALVAPADAQQRRPITIPEFIGLERPGEPALSPDGWWVAFSVTTTDLAANRRRTDLWLAARDGSAPPRRISTDSLGGRSAAWAPDGTRLVFVSSRGGTPQLWTWEVASGRLTQVTRLSTGADGPKWAPDGRSIAFVSEVYPDCRDDACNQRRAAEDERRPSRARLIEGLLFRHWNTWEDGLRSHLFVAAADGATPARDLLAGVDTDVPVPPFGGREQYAWSTDSRTLAYTTKLPTRDQAWTTNNDVYTVPAAGGMPTLVTANLPGADQDPQFSPDGRALAWLSQERAGFEADRWRLMVKDLASGRVREVPRGWDYNIGEYAWLPGGDFMAVSEKRGRNELLHIVGASGDVHEVMTDMNPGQMSVVAPGGRISVAFVSDASDKPADVYAWTVDHQRPEAPRNLSRLNTALLGRLAMNPARHIGWVGADGDSVFGWLLTPPNFDPNRRYPLVLLVHGGPQGAWTDQFHGRWNTQLFAAPGYVVFAPNPRGSTGYGQRFTDQISRDWGGRVYEDLMRGVDVVARLPYVDSTRMAAAGGSYGGYMVNWINGHTGRFKALVSHAGVFNLEHMYAATEELWFPEWEYGGPYWMDRTDYERWSPHRFVRNFRTPTLVIHGALDFRVLETEGMQMFTALQREGVASKLLYFPDEGHWIGRPANQQVWWTTVHEWLGTYLR